VPLLKRKKIKAKKQIKNLKKNYLIPKISMELPIGTIETLVNCNSQRKKKKFSEEISASSKHVSEAKICKKYNNGFALSLIACLLGHSSVFTLANLVKKTANKKTIDGSLYLHR
jgi:hypothetical protein